MKKVYSIVILGIFVLISLLIYIYHLNFGLTANAFENGLNSIIINLIVLIFTVIIINILFTYHHERINKEKERENYLKVLSESHKTLVFNLKIYIISFVLKKPAITKPDKNDKLQHVIKLPDLKERLHKYINPDFFTIPNQVMEFDHINFDTNFLEVSHTDWLLINNNNILARIHKYLMLYSKLMPNDILKLLVEIELVLTRESVFMVPPDENIRDMLNKNILEDGNEKEVQSQIAKVIDKIIEFEKRV